VRGAVVDDETFSPLQRRLFVFLGVACLFEGWDYYAITQILPNLRAQWGLSESQGTLMIATLSIGSLLAFFLVRRADVVGRRPVMGLTILGYTLASLASGFAPGPISFTLAQLVARFFLAAEWSLAMVYAAEEFPARRRGLVVGVIQAFARLGAIVCAGAAPFVLATSWSWRGLYWIGALPLVLLMVARRALPETSRFTALSTTTATTATTTAGPATPPDLWRIWRTPHRRRVLQLAVIWGATYVCTNNAITFWKEFAVHERGLSDADVGRMLTIAAIASLPLVFGAGKILDVVGRRRGATLIYLLSAASVFLVYTLHDVTALTVTLTLTIAAVNAVMPLLNSYTAELFPTDLRADAWAWSNNLLGRITFVLSPLVLGVIADDDAFGTGLGLGQGFGVAVSSTSLSVLLALVCILRWLPETRGRELEDTSRLAD
jgi:putative MFS transporter